MSRGAVNTQGWDQVCPLENEFQGTHSTAVPHLGGAAQGREEGLADREAQGREHSLRLGGMEMGL